MKNLLSIFLICIAFCATAQHSVDCKDNPLFTRMPHTHIGDCSSHLEEVEVPVSMDKNKEVEGVKNSIEYIYEESEATAPTFSKVLKHHETEISKIGGKRVFFSKEEGVATLYAKSGGKDVWVILHDFSGGKKGSYRLEVLEVPNKK